MRIALDRIFRKKILLWIIIVTLFFAVKIGSAFLFDKQYPEFQHLDTWITDCQGLDDNALEDYVAELADEIGSDKQKQRTMGQELSELLDSYENRLFIQNLVSFAQKGEGVLSAKIPHNFEKLLDFYKTLDTPSIINEQPLDRFFGMQKVNIIPLVVLLLTAFFWGEFYESGIYKLTASMKEGDHYTIATHILLAGTSLLFLLINELTDLWYSGVFRYPYIWDCPVQSYHNFRYVQMNTTLGAALLLSFISKFLGTLVLCHCGLLIARWKQTVKDSVVYAVILIVLLFFVGKALENTDLRSVQQLGIIDWQSVLCSTAIILPLQVNSLVLGFVIVIVLGVLLACYTFHRYHKHRH